MENSVITDGSTRRQFLGTMAGVGLAVGVAGCSGDSGETATVELVNLTASVGDDEQQLFSDEEATIDPLAPFPVVGDLAIDPAPLYRDFPDEASYLRESEANPEPELQQELETALMVYFLGILDSARLATSTKVSVKVSDILSLLRRTIEQALGVSLPRRDS